MSEPIDIDPDQARQLADEVEADWQAALDHPVLGPFIRAFRIPRADECP